MVRKRNKLRKINPRILILCEGETEKLYLNGLLSTLDRQIQRDISIIVQKAYQTEPQMMFKEAIAKKKKGISEQQPYKEIWLVFDDDNRTNFKTIFSEAQRNNFKIAYSSISVELWFLLHFEKRAHIFSGAGKAKSYLEKYIHGYHETIPGLYDTLLTKYMYAKSNAEWLRKQKSCRNMYEIYKHKPITNIDVLTEEIKNYNIIHVIQNHKIGL